MGILLFLNSNFEFLVAIVLGVLCGAAAAGVAIWLRFLPVREFFPRLIFYVVLGAFTFVVTASYAVSTLDPDYSPFQRYRIAWREIKSWFWVKDPLLAPDGLERALHLGTGWVARPEPVFYVIDDKLYSVLSNGRNETLHYAAGEPIRSVKFSPDGKKLALQTREQLLVLSLINDEINNVYTVAPMDASSDIRQSHIGGVQWSRDSRKVCFFVDQQSAVSSRTSWYVYDLVQGEKIKLPLGAEQNVFLWWGRDSERLFLKRLIPGK